METQQKARLLRIYVSNTDKVKHTSLYEAIAFAAKRYGLAGITVTKGIMGFGSSSSLQSNKFWELVEKYPVILEVIDERKKIDGFVKSITPWIKLLPKGLLMISSDVDITFYKKGGVL